MREYLKIMRKDRDLSQETLSCKLGMKQHSYSAIENGNHQRDMAYSIMERLAEAFGVPVQIIIDAEIAYKGANDDKSA